MTGMDRRSKALRLGVLFSLGMLVALAIRGDTVTVRGIIRDPEGQPVVAARIEVDGKVLGASDGEGVFALDLPVGIWPLAVHHAAFATVETTVEITGTTPWVDLQFERIAPVDESITVTGIRAGERVPVTKTNLSEEEIQRLSYGQDVPALLQYTPALTWTSDSGIGANYSYLSLRGIQQTRINMTYDGAPLNDPAEHAVYFNNFHDFISEVDSIQIQRGVGTSSVGSPSFGGSVNFASSPWTARRGGDARLSLGSYDSMRGSVGYATEVFDNGLALSGRISWAETDGYRERSGSKHRTLFFNAGWQGERSSLKFVSFFGDERSQLAFLAVDPETLAQNRRFNPLDEEERDQFGQDFAQLKFTRAFGDATLLTASLYYNGADGWFRLWDDPEARNELLEFGIDQAFIGSMVTASWSWGRLDWTAGVHFNDFRGDHTLDDSRQRVYLNTGFKQIFNAFTKVEAPLGSWLLFGDFQGRWAEFSYEGDVDLGSVEWTFFDPKLGIRRSVSPNLSVYASIGRAQREPSRMDLLLGEDNATVSHDVEAVRPESVVDLELGVDWVTAAVGLEANLYAMEFSNEIALTGELSDIGLPVRRNVKDSYRRGLEWDVRWTLNGHWSIRHSANLSRNRIRDWTQFFDVYDSSGAWIDSLPVNYRRVRPLLTPEAIVNAGFQWSGSRVSIAMMGRYVDTSQLDNTDSRELRTPSYANADLRASISLDHWLPGLRPELVVFLNNLFDSQEQYSSGYSYQYVTRDAVGQDAFGGTPYYYPLATRNVIVSLQVGF